MKVHALIALVNAHRAKYKSSSLVAIDVVCADLRVNSADRQTLERLYCVKRAGV